MVGSLLRRAVIALVIGALLVPGLGAPATAATSGPSVFWGEKRGPVAIPVKLRTVARLRLPAGRWSVMVKAVLVGRGGTLGTHLGTVCRLQVGKRSDVVNATPNSEDSDGSRLPMLLTAAGGLKRPGVAKLRCAGELGGAVVIRDIQMAAMRVGTLTTRGVIVPTATSGSGRPNVISARRSAATSIAGDGAFHTVAEVPIPRGRWWILAKAVATDGNVSDDYRCRLVAAPDFDEVRFSNAPTGFALDAVPLALQVVHRYASPGIARLECRGPFGFDVRAVVITATKAERLSNRTLLAARPSALVPWPRVIAGFADGPVSVPFSGSFKTMAAMDLPNGRWLVIAKEWFEADVPSIVATRRVQCRLVVGRRSDPAELQYQNNITDTGVLVHLLVVRSTNRNAAALKCRRIEGSGTAAVHFVKITALRLGTFTKLGL